MYDFVIFGSDNDYNLVTLNDIINLDNVNYLQKELQSDNHLLIHAHRIHRSSIINKNIKLPLKEFWNPLYYKNVFKDDRNLCFIYFQRRYERLKEVNFIDYIKRKYPTAKHVFYYTDLISTTKNFDIKYVKDNFDLVLTYDYGEAEKYGIAYYPGPYSKIAIDIPSSAANYDVFFVGRAKNRIKEVLKIYEKLRGNDLKCDFYISDVDPDDQLYKNDIHYNQWITYKEVLQKVNTSNCNLEYIQENSSGYTLRTCEAIAYNKKLISNNSKLCCAPFYNPKYISVFKDIQDLDIDFIKDKNESINFNYIDELSPRKLLLFIDNYFKK